MTEIAQLTETDTMTQIIHEIERIMQKIEGLNTSDPIIKLSNYHLSKAISYLTHLELIT